jgi:adenosylhomocysteine nucleosidase
MLSGDSFISNRAKMELIVGQHFAKDFPIAVDMESGAIAQTCYYYGLPFLVLRAVSDKVGSENQHMSFTTFVRESSKKSTALLGHLLSQLPTTLD